MQNRKMVSRNTIPAVSNFLVKIVIPDSIRFIKKSNIFEWMTERLTACEKIFLVCALRERDFWSEACSFFSSSC